MKNFYEEWLNDIESTLDDIVYHIIGTDQGNPAYLTSNNWLGVDVDNQQRVAEAAGTPDGGVYYIDVRSAGTFRLALSRWPFHLDRDLTMAGPETTIGGKPLVTGKALPVEFGCVSLDEGDPIVEGKNPGASRIEIETELTEGKHTLRAWFRDENGSDLCGAYYVQIGKILSPAAVPNE